MDKNRVLIFDTTLRDGEQSPGASMNIDEKIHVAAQLERLGVDIIEAGFAAASPGDFDAISQIAKNSEKIVVCSLARAVERDILAAANALKGAKFSRIHIFIATSPIHMEYKLKMSPDVVIKRAVEAVEYAKTFTNDVEFSCEDATRSEIPFLKEICDAAIMAGATTINLPDTVGYRTPSEMAEFISEMAHFIGDRAILSVHNHNDLGLAVANSLFSIKNGARQVECTINGIGERAGNAALEEIVMAMKTRKDIFGVLHTGINFKEIYPTSRLIASVTGIEPQPNKAIVGKNAFLHESGIHQDGVLKHAQTYEIMCASDIGLQKDNLVLGKHSGRHAFSEKLKFLGIELDEGELNRAFEKFKILADKKKEIFDDDLRALITDEMVKPPRNLEVLSLSFALTSGADAGAKISLKKDGEICTDEAVGNGVIDALFKAIDKITKISGALKDYQVKSVSQGKDALANVVVKIQFEEEGAYIGHGLDVDTLMASAKAYIGALNNYLSTKK